MRRPTINNSLWIVGWIVPVFPSHKLVRQRRRLESRRYFRNRYALLTHAPLPGCEGSDSSGFSVDAPPFVSSNCRPAIYAFSMGARDEQSVNADEVERRAFPRISFRFPVRMTIISSPGRESDNAQCIHVQGHDLSEGGMSIICARKLEVGQELELEMPGRIRAAVVRCVESKERGRYLIGCQFIN
jgi:PilZ domain